MAVERCCGGIINVAAAQPVTMLKLAQTVVGVIGRGNIRLNEQEDPNEQETARYDIRRAAQVLDWQAMIGLRESLNWIREEPLTD
jgi:nucleoside-diphosphate-sugar epimerase